MKREDARALARSLMDAAGLTDWRFRFDHAKRRAGACTHTSRTISLSGPLTDLYDEGTIRGVILHEIAHALVGPTVEAGRTSPRRPGFRAVALVPALPGRALGGHMPALRGHTTPVPGTAPPLLVRGVLARLQPGVDPHVGAPRKGRLARARLRARARLDPPLGPTPTESEHGASYPKMSHVIPPTLFQILKPDR